MHIAALAIEKARKVTPDEDAIGWFVVRQPGIVGFLERRFVGKADAFALALAGAWRIITAYHESDGLPSPRLAGSLLDRASIEVTLESRGPVKDGGLAHRQPEATQYVGDLLADPPYPLDATERIAVAQALLSVIYAIDDTAFGRPF